MGLVKVLNELSFTINGNENDILGVNLYYTLLPCLSGRAGSGGSPREQGVEVVWYGWVAVETPIHRVSYAQTIPYERMTRPQPIGEWMVPKQN